LFPFIAALTLALLAAAPAFARQKHYILFIIGDDIGWMQPSIYHRGLILGRDAQDRPHPKRGRDLRALLACYRA